MDIARNSGTLLHFMEADVTCIYPKFRQTPENIVQSWIGTGTEMYIKHVCQCFRIEKLASH